MRGFDRALMVMCAGVLAASVLVISTGAGQRAGAAEGDKIGVVDVVGILQEMLRTDEYSKPREQVREAAISELSGMEDNLRRMTQELQLIPPTEQQRGQALYAQLQQEQQKYQEASRSRSDEYLAFSGDQAAAVYERIYAAVDAVSEREGYDYVFSTRSGGVLEETSNLNTVTQGMLSRPLLRFPAEVDLTDLVRAEIGYEPPVEEPAAEDAGESVEPEAGGDGGG